MQFIGYGSFIKDKDAFLYYNVTMDTPINAISLSGGYFGAFYVSSDASLAQYDNGMPNTWDEASTIMKTDFNNTCNVNESMIDLTAIDGIAVKRRINKPDEKWQTMYIQPIKDVADFNFTFVDYFCKNNCDYQYNLLPVKDGKETYLDYIKDVHSCFNGIHFTDGKSQYGSTFDITSSYNRHTSSSTVIPINSKYPVAIKNGHLNYSSGNVTIRFLKMDDTDMPDMENEFDYRTDIIDFLSESNILVFKNYDGFIAIISIENEISQDFGDYYLAPKISFSWIQTGDAEDCLQLRNFGLIKSGD